MSLTQYCSLPGAAFNVVTFRPRHVWVTFAGREAAPTKRALQRKCLAWPDRRLLPCIPLAPGPWPREPAGPRPPMQDTSSPRPSRALYPASASQTAWRRSRDAVRSGPGPPGSSSIVPPLAAVARAGAERSGPSVMSPGVRSVRFAGHDADSGCPQGRRARRQGTPMQPEPRRGPGLLPIPHHSRTERLRSRGMTQVAG